MAFHDSLALAWWSPGDVVGTLQTAIDQHSSAAQAVQLGKFVPSSFVVYTYLSNKLEGTLPAGVKEHETFKLLMADFMLGLPVDLRILQKAPEQHWPAEGGKSSAAAAKAQLMQSLAALKYMCLDRHPGSQPLSTEMIRTAHKLMLWGAVDDDGVLLNAGSYREQAAHSGTGFIYADHTVIPSGLEAIVKEYNEASAKQPPAMAAAQLLYSVVTLHPFSNGNGRLCRLLAAYALMARGCPFPVPLTNGHMRARKHYEQCMLYADKHGGDVRRLACFVLECVHIKWSNFAIISKFG